MAKLFSLVLGSVTVCLFSFCGAGNTIAKEDSSDNTPVTYSSLVIPGEPDWYSTIPSVMLFNDQNKQLATSVQVEFSEVNLTPKTITVKVKSTNGYQLKEQGKPAIPYCLLDANGKKLKQNRTMQSIGDFKVIQKGVLNSNALLISEASISGCYTDRLNYYFEETN